MKLRGLGLRVKGFCFLTDKGMNEQTIVIVELHIVSFKVELSTMIQDECRKFHNSCTEEELDPLTGECGFNNDTLSADMICAYGDGGKKNVCENDSGGPLVTKVDDHYVVVGIASWVRGGYQVQCGMSKYPGVYARVSYLLEWIRKYINREAFKIREGFSSQYCDICTKM